MPVPKNGCGALGVGYSSSSPFYEDGQDQIYNRWYSMLDRCYGKRFKKPYVNCRVSEAWHDFQKFAKWYSENFVENWDLDKDILGNGMLYSEEYCCFVPREINCLFQTPKKIRELPQGVSYHKLSKKYRADVGKKALGLFETAETAHNAYLAEKANICEKLAEDYKNNLDIRVYERLMEYAKNCRESCSKTDNS